LYKDAKNAQNVLRQLLDSISRFLFNILLHRMNVVKPNNAASTSREEELLS